MQLAGDGAEHNSFQASMLHMAYNNLLILLHRSAFISNVEDKDGDADGNIALQAAARNSRIVEDLLPTGNIGHAPLHVITNLFNTLCIHVAHLRRTSGINKTITEHRAKLCLLGLQDLQKTWEVTNWVLQLFFQYLDRATAARLEMEADGMGITSAVKHAANDTASAPTVHTPRQTSDAPGAELTRPQGQTPANNNDVDNVMTPWSWTTDEANQYLFSQIENDFAFGEGGNFEWSPEQMFGGLGMGSVLSELAYNNNHPQPDSSTSLM
jgi:ankyrin repeat protein